jgi:COMPASS component SPP1
MAESSEATVSSPEDYNETERLENLRLIQEANAQAHPNNVRPVEGLIKKQKLNRRTSRTPQQQESNATGEDLYCICRKPDSGEWMIACDFCDQWYHGTCIKLDESDSPLIVKYCCPPCVEKGKGQTVWRRKCRLKECKNPVDGNGTKYCCRAHGLLFFRTKVGPGAKYSNALDEGTLASLMDQCKNVEDFRALGGEVRQVDENEVLMKLDQRALDAINTKKEQLEHEIEDWKKRLKYLKLAKDRMKRVSEEATQENGGKKKDICGLDPLFVNDDTETINKLASQESLQGHDEICMEERRKCVRHKDWTKIIAMEAEVGINKCNNALNLLESQIHEMKNRAKIHALSSPS